MNWFYRASFNIFPLSPSRCGLACMISISPSSSLRVISFASLDPHLNPCRVFSMAGHAILHFITEIPFCHYLDRTSQWSIGDGWRNGPLTSRQHSPGIRPLLCGTGIWEAYGSQEFLEMCEETPPPGHIPWSWASITLSWEGEREAVACHLSLSSLRCSRLP